MGGVVANAGPLMALSKPNLLHLLKAPYGRVSFAPSVYDEVVAEQAPLGRAGQAGRAEPLPPRCTGHVHSASRLEPDCAAARGGLGS